MLKEKIIKCGYGIVRNEHHGNVGERFEIQMEHFKRTSMMSPETRQKEKQGTDSQRFLDKIYDKMLNVR